MTALFAIITQVPRPMAPKLISKGGSSADYDCRPFLVGWVILIGFIIYCAKGFCRTWFLYARNTYLVLRYGREAVVSQP